MTWLYRRRISVGCFGHATGQRCEIQRFQKANELWTILWLKHQTVEINFERHVCFKRYELPRDFCLVSKSDDIFTTFVLLDLRSACEQRIKIAKLFQQLRSGLRANAWNSRYIIGAIASQRLQIDHLFRRHAPFFNHFRDRNLLVLHAVIHGHLWRHELHEIFIGRNDCNIAACIFSQTGIGCDQVVGLKTFLFDARQIECTRCLTDQAELRNEIFRRRGAVCLILGKNLFAESLRRVIENDRKMRRHHTNIGAARILQQLPQHVAETRHGPNRQAVRLTRQRWQGMIGTENIARAVNEEEMITFFHGLELKETKLKENRPYVRRNECPPLDRTSALFRDGSYSRSSCMNSPET